MGNEKRDSYKIYIEELGDLSWTRLEDTIKILQEKYEELKDKYSSMYLEVRPDFDETYRFTIQCSRSETEKEAESRIAEESKKEINQLEILAEKHGKTVI